VECSWSIEPLSCSERCRAGSPSAPGAPAAGTRLCGAGKGPANGPTPARRTPHQGCAGISRPPGGLRVRENLLHPGSPPPCLPASQPSTPRRKHPTSSQPAPGRAQPFGVSDLFVLKFMPKVHPAAAQTPASPSSPCPSAAPGRRQGTGSLVACPPRARRDKFYKQGEIYK